MRSKLWLSIIVALIFLIIFISWPKHETKLAGESEYDSIIKNLISGGPPKDGIPSIDNPIYVSSNEANLKDQDLVFGINYKGFVAAYPQSIMYWHEIVNEEVDGEKISITYCPLTRSIIGFKGYELGVSGELYNSNLVMYDRASDSRIPQILGEGIEGNLKGSELEEFPVVVTSWKKWKTKFPDSLVLSRDLGFNRNYDQNPYPGYEDILRVWFPLAHESSQLKSKEIVVGFENKGKFLAVVKDGFNEKYPNGLEVELGGENFFLIYDQKLDVLVSEKEIDSFEVYWFAWYAYHPNTEIIK
jgi:hypothetical protein